MCLVGFASIAIVVVCGRCVLHRLFATTCKHPCLKPLGTHAKASLPLYECSVGFASLPRQPLVPLHRTPPFPQLQQTAPSPSPFPTTTINPKRKALKRSPVAKTGNGASVLYIGFTLSIFQHRQQAQRFRVRDYPSSQAYIRRPKFRLFPRCRQASAYSCYRLPCRLRSACRCLYGR